MREFWNRNGLMVLFGALICLMAVLAMLGPPIPPRKPQVVTLTAEDRRFIADAIASAAKKGCP